MKKYIYRPQKCVSCSNVKWTKNGIEEINTWLSNYSLKEIYFNTLDELKEELVKQLYSIDFNQDYDDMIFVHWYETYDGDPVNISDSDQDWKNWCDGVIPLWEYSLNIEASDIYLNQTIDCLDELR